MGTVTGYTAERMKAIEDASVVNGEVDPDTGHLMLTRFDETPIDAGKVSVAYVSTVAGPPVAGAHEKGDTAVDNAGRVWICTIAGTPGTWVDVSSGKELGHVEVGTQSTASTSAVDVPGLVLNNVPIGQRPVQVILSGGMMNHTVAGARASVAIMEDGVFIGGITFANHPTASRWTPGPYRRIRRNPAAGNHTYKVQFWVTDAGTFQLTAGILVGVDYGPLSLSVVEL